MSKCILIMKLLYFFAFIFLSSLTGGDISEANRYKDLAYEAYRTGDYKLAIQRYHYLLDTLHLKDPALSLNLGHAYFQYLQKMDQDGAMPSETDETEAKSASGLKMLEYYTQAANESNDQLIKANAYNQMGIGFMQLTQSFNNDDEEAPSVEERFEAALSSFKNALRNDPYNENTRYNYELVKKLFEEFKKKQEEEKKQNKQDEKEDKKDKKDSKEEKEDKEKKDEQKDKKDEADQKDSDKGEDTKEQQGKNEGENKQKQEGKANQKDQGDPSEEGDGKEDKEGGKKEGGTGSKEDPTKEQKEALKKMMNTQRLKEINMTKEKARMILEAMKAQEMQYYQNMRKGVRKAKKSSKPDW